jgi:PAS domain S-box-containing protein
MILLVVATIVTVCLAIYAWQRRTVSAAGAFAWLMMGATSWSLLLILLHVSKNSDTAFFWSRVWYTNAAIVPVLWVFFAFRYMKYDKYLAIWQIIGLMVIPLSTTILVWTNQSHGLFWQSLDFGRTGFFMLPKDVSFGLWYVVHSAYSYVLLGLGMVLMVKSVLHAPHLYRSQVVALMMGVTLPLVASLPSTFGFVKLETTSFGLALSGVTVTWALFRYKFLDLIPVARDQLIDSMYDGMLVLDMRNRVVDLNRTMRKMIGLSMDEVIGESVTKLLQPGSQNGSWQQLVRCFQHGKAQTEISLCWAGVEHYYDLRISPLTDHRGQVTGRLIVLRDITKRKRAEQELQNYASEIELRNRELEDALHAIKTLSELVPICAWCGRKIQDNAGQWIEVQTYIESHSETKFTHGICPDCLKKIHVSRERH